MLLWSSAFELMTMWTFSLGLDPERNSFITIAENLFQFSGVNAFLSNLRRRVEIFGCSDELCKIFMDHCAVFHKSCISNYNKMKLLRKRKLEETFSSRGKPEPDQFPDQPLPNVNLMSGNAKDWLACLENAPERNEQTNRVSFSAIFSSTAEQHTFKTTSTLLPLLEESINSPAMVRHFMDIIKELVRHLNPDQMIMITAD